MADDTLATPDITDTAAKILDEPPVRYRVGRKLGRTIYRQYGAKPSDSDEFIGIMDTAHDAHYFVALANEKLGG